MKLFLKTADYFLTKEKFDLVYDPELEMLRTSPQPDQLARYYEAENYISHTDSKTGFLDKLYQTVKQYNLKRKLALAAAYAGDQKSLLDIGAGTGEFLSIAKTKAWSVAGVEPNATAQQLAAAKGITLVDDLSNLNSEKFKIVSLWHVLEHMPDLEKSIANICDKVAAGGTLLIAVPNYKSFDAKFYHTHWAAYDVPRHLWHFSKTAIEKLLLKQQFKLVKVKPMWFDAFYVSLLSESYKTGRKNWLRAFCIGFWSNLSGLFTKEYSSHIYILQKKV